MLVGIQFGQQSSVLVFNQQIGFVSEIKNFDFYSSCHMPSLQFKFKLFQSFITCCCTICLASCTSFVYEKKRQLYIVIRKLTVYSIFFNKLTGCPVSSVDNVENRETKIVNNIKIINFLFI